MKMRDMFPSKYINAGDLQPDRDVLVAIRDLQMVTIEGEDEPKPCLCFHGAKKGLILNKTNCLVLAQGLGEDSNSWIGKTVALFATTTQFGGKLVPCVRLKVPSPPPSSATAPPSAAFDADLPFDGGSGTAADEQVPF